MEHVDVVIIGAGQAGLATAYEARRARLDAIVLEATDQPGGAWRNHYDSLKLFSPARYSELPGKTFPGDPDRYPTRDEIVAYLRDYATQFAPAVSVGQRVQTVDPQPDGGFMTTTASGRKLTFALYANDRPADAPSATAAADAALLLIAAEN